MLCLGFLKINVDNHFIDQRCYLFFNIYLDHKSAELYFFFSGGGGGVQINKNKTFA